MLSSFKGKGTEINASNPTGLAGIIAASAPTPRLPPEPSMPPPPRPAARTESPAAKPETVSNIGSSMSIVGQVVCTGQARVFGRVEGELRASELLIGSGSQIEGTVVAQEVIVRGHVKGTIRAVRVRLEDGASVEGDIFHRSLAIEEGAVFDGASRRVDNPTDAPIADPETVATAEPHDSAATAIVMPLAAAAAAPVMAAAAAAPIAAEAPRADQAFR
jgi:cytoskeletal protein CcmA (bactofilin family)